MKNAQGDYDRRMRNAYAVTDYAEAKAELQKILWQFERVNPSAAHSLEEGLEETLTVHRLGVGALLQSDRIVPFHGGTDGQKCETLAW